MNENSKIRMKMSIANELVHDQRQGDENRDADRKKDEPARAYAAHHRAFPPSPVGLKASVSSSMANTTINPESAPTILNPEGFGDPHHQAGDQRADHIAERAHDHGDEGHQHEHLSDKRVGRIERHQQRAGGAGQRQRDAKRYAKNPIGVDAHQRRHVAVLGRGAHRLAEVGGVQEHPERAAQQHRDDKGDQFGHRDVEPAEMKGFVGIRGMDGAVIGGEQHQREIQQQQRQREGQEDLRHVVGPQYPADQEMLDQDTGNKQHRHRHDERYQWIDAELVGEKEGDVHPDHHEFALGEIDDLDHAEDQRDADADERVNAADEQAVDDGLGHCLPHLA